MKTKIGTPWHPGDARGLQTYKYLGARDYRKNKQSGTFNSKLKCRGETPVEIKISECVKDFYIYT